MRTADPVKVRAARRCLASGRYSQREIARALGLGRGTVAKLALGEAVALEREPGPEPAEDGPYERCPVHGVLVRMPCVQCRTEDYMRRRREKRQTPAEGRP